MIMCDDDIRQYLKDQAGIGENPTPSLEIRMILKNDEFQFNYQNEDYHWEMISNHFES